MFVFLKNRGTCQFSGTVFLSSMKMIPYLALETSQSAHNCSMESQFHVSGILKETSDVHSLCWTGVPQQQERQMA